MTSEKETLRDLAQNVYENLQVSLRTIAVENKELCEILDKSVPEAEAYGPAAGWGTHCEAPDAIGRAMDGLQDSLILVKEVREKAEKELEEEGKKIKRKKRQREEHVTDRPKGVSE